MTRRSCILVLGMHRSGTSALTRVLNLLGATLPEALLGPNRGNELGHWEPIRLVALNDKLLAECGSQWDDFRPLDLTSLPSDRLEFYKAEISKLITREYGKATSIVIKDPRICRLAGLYTKILEEEGWNVTILIPFRNPIDVAQSLHARDGKPISDGMLLWLRHVLDVEYQTRSNKRLFFEFGSFLKSPLQLVKAITRVTPKGALISSRDEIENAISFVQPELLHHETDGAALLQNPISQDWPLATYSTLKAVGRKDLNADQRQSFDSIRNGFDVASRLITIKASELVDTIKIRDADIERLSSELKTSDKKNYDHLATNAQLDKLLQDEKRKLEKSTQSALQLSNQLKAGRKKLIGLKNTNEQLAQELESARVMSEESAELAKRTGRELDTLNKNYEQKLAELSTAQSELTELFRFKVDVLENSTLGILKDTARGKELKETPLVSVIIPVKNGLPEFRRVMDALQEQVLDEPFEVIVIDSGSKDGSIQAIPLDDPRFRLIEIEPASFGHGKTRNLGIEKAKGKFCAFLTHDATPVDKFWIREIIKPLRENEDVAGVFGRHIAYEDATPFTKWELETHFSGLKNWMEVSLTDAREYVRNQGLRQVYHFYSDNASCMRKSVWEKHPYPNVNFAEDQLWAKEIVEAGYKKAFAWDAVVYHSHDYSIWERFQRSYDESLALNEYFGYEFCPTKKQLLGQTFKTTVRDMKLAFKNGWWLSSPIDTLKKPFDNFARQAGYYMGTTRSEFARKHDKKLSRDRQMQSR